MKMLIKSWGTRGSISISNAESVDKGGNTTCFEVMSDCLPKGTKLMLDAGTGFVPAGTHYLSEIENGLNYVILFTHYHWDHIMGLTLSPPTFIEQIPMNLYGPNDLGFGPKEMVNYLFKRPFFPVDDKSFNHKMTFKTLNDFDVHVIVIHPKGGFTTLQLNRFKSMVSGKKQIPINGKSYDLNECMVVKMAKTNHSNSNCISYRFEEMPTGKVFVFCTDHEQYASMPMNLRNHMMDADLLVIDAQYDRERYVKTTAGYGHGTPHGIIQQAIISNVATVGITHHDPSSKDTFINKVILEEARTALDVFTADENFLGTYKINSSKIRLKEDRIFTCNDYYEYHV